MLVKFNKSQGVFYEKIMALLSLAAFAFAAVDINSASVEELTKVKGLGKAKAMWIIEKQNVSTM